MAGQPPDQSTFDSLAAGLRKLANGRDTLDVAQFQFVGLDEIAHAYGERWTAQRRRIEDSAETFLRQRMDASDVLVRAGGGFVIVLGSAVGPEAHAVAAQLVHGLNSFFLGEASEGGSPTFDSTVVTMSPQDLKGAFGDLEVTEREKVRELVEPLGLPDLEWGFEPSWDVKHETLSIWMATPYARTTGKRLTGYRFENFAAHPNRFLKIDEAALWIAEQALQELISAEKRTLVGATLHVGTLANLESRARILATISRLDPELHRYRIIKIAGVAPGFPRMYLKEIVGVLKSRLPHIVVSAAWDEPDIAGLVQTGVAALGFSIPPSAVTAGPLVTVPQLMARVSDAVASAHASRVRFFVEGDIPKLLALRLARSGVDLLSSESIWATRPIPDGMVKWPSDRLIAA
jgi:hypothetical protein